MQSLSLLVSVLLLVTTLLVTAEHEVPTFSQCRPHIEATIQELANKAQGSSDLTHIPLAGDAHPEPPADEEETPPAVAEQVLEEEPEQEVTTTGPEEPPVEESPPVSEVMDSDEEVEPAAEVASEAPVEEEEVDEEPAAEVSKEVLVEEEEVDDEPAAEEVSKEVPVEEEEVDEEPAAEEEKPASEEYVSEDEEEDSGEIDDEDGEEQETEEEVKEEEEEVKEAESDDVDDEEEEEDEEVEHGDDEKHADKEDLDALKDNDDEEEDVHAQESDISAEEDEEAIDADVDRESIEEESEKEKEDEGKDEHDDGDDDDESESEEVDGEMDAEYVSEEDKANEVHVDDEEAEEVEVEEEVEEDKKEEDEDVGDEGDDRKIDGKFKDMSEEDEEEKEEVGEEERDEEEMVDSDKKVEKGEEEKKIDDEEEKEDVEENMEEGKSDDRLTVKDLEPEVAAESESKTTAETKPEVTVETEPDVAPETDVKEPDEPVAVDPEATGAEAPRPSEAEEETSKPSELKELKIETPESVRTTPPSPIKLSFTDKVINLIFGGVSTEPRDPKWAKPWQTHKPIVKAEPVQDTPVKEGGFFSRAMNKFVGLIFGEAEGGKRDPKWAQPWQTHKSLPETPKEEKTPIKKVDTSGGFMHSIIKVFFGDPSKGLEPGQGRDPKWAKPWQTHKDLEEEPQPKSSVEKKKKEKKVETPEGFVRDPKWAEPWQTHKDKVEVSQSREEPKPMKVTSDGFIHSFISLFFGAPKAERDPKWAEPWQSHRGEEKSVKEDKPAAPEMAKTERDPKWSKPWQTHREDEKAEKPKDAPKPKVPKVERDPKWAQPWQTHQAVIEKPKKAPKPVMPKVERDPKWAYPWQMHKQLEEQAKAGIPIQPPKPVEAKEAQPEPEPGAEDFPSPEVARRVKEPTKVAGDQHPDSAEATKQPLLEEVEEEEEVFVIEEEEDPEQIIVVPAIRSRDHVETILGLDESSKGADARIAPVADAVLKDLKDVYDNAIKPLESLYKYQDISNRHMADAEIFGTPMVLLLGPYSTGKSSFINYLLGIEYTKSALKTGLPPSHGVFRILQYGESAHELTGTDISANHVFASLQKFGQNFIDQLSGKVLTNPLLKKMTIVETPGILEMRRSNERLYPLNDVLQWFIDRSDLILVMFDYTKLDAGYEMEAIFDQLKGREAQTRILLNKADQVPPEELIKVQGSLFWNLSPLLGVASPPTVYAGSFSSAPYKVSSPIKLFKAQEVALLTDIANAINSKVDNRIAIARRHAVRVRNHAHMVDNYLSTYYRNKGFLTSKHKLSDDIIENPHAYNIYEGMSLLTNISRYDLPDPEVYRDFFRIHNLYDFPTLKETCSYMRGCPLSKIDAAISTDLPALRSRFHRLATAAGMPQAAHVPSPMPAMPSASRAAPPPPSTTS